MSPLRGWWRSRGDGFTQLELFSPVETRLGASPLSLRDVASHVSLPTSSPESRLPRYARHAWVRDRSPHMGGEAGCGYPCLVSPTSSCRVWRRISMPAS